MAYSNALSAYRETRIRTASQGQLVVMLYDEAVKQLDSALESLARTERDSRDPRFIEKINKSVVKAQEIVTELMASLDFDAGGEIASNLFSLYNWFNRELLQANIARDEKRIRAVRDQVDELRLAWHQAVAKTSAEASGKPSGGVNIAG
ncbi:MAG: flagellar export chaperone FliS [Treponema sp. GWB1_62_6]|nr:MAG: flagellar export chaperone FliS [Treponema sp. GWB1_62_6]OHE75692.1 MAG: flagellar export chaperone FliS [Treponema sp. RIFOXYC1_FULL_61_9]HCM26182.1 flagellar export chaperone FliS [Treponema sp.]